MGEEARETGINVIGTVPWGTHICLFYDTKQDLVDILVPYFKAGLENNESCIWVTAEPLNEEEAKQTMIKAMPDFAGYLESGQIAIVPHTKVYLKDGVFNLQRVLNAWLDELNKALAKGYHGMRITGNMAWLEEEDWTSFTEYEEELNSAIGKYHMLVICTYPLAKCRASELIDVMRNHQFALIRQAGDWVLLGPRERRVTPLQKWFTRSGFEGLHDQEMIELLLSLVLPSRECKRLARDCIKRFKSLRKFLAASPKELQQIGFTRPCLFCIKLLYELPAEILKQKIIDQPVYKSPEEIYNYLCYSMRDLRKETFKIIYLNSQSQIIDTITLSKGTVNSIFIHPRQIIEGAIKYNAASLIFVHNHPSGNPKPSRGDKQLTGELVFIGEILKIRVLDHIIIGGNKYFSFADQGLITRYEDDFLNLRLRRLVHKKQANKITPPAQPIKPLTPFP